MPEIFANDTNSTLHPAPTIVYIAGRPLHEVSADRFMAEALSQFVHVLWVDPVRLALRGRRCAPRSTVISPRFTQLSTFAPTVPIGAVSRAIARRALDDAIAATLSDLGVTSSATVLSDPIGRFPESVDGHRFFYVTDDWVSGAPRAGRSRRSVRRAIEINSARADTVAAVSHTLALRLHLYSRSVDAVRVVPAGCELPAAPRCSPPDLDRIAPVALVGDLDEQLDYDVLDAVADTGQRIVVIGANTARTPSTTVRVDAFLSRSTVRWLGAHPDAATGDYLAEASVGIAPFVVDAFNRARFPTNTLDYLAAGLPVVTTDLPATRWLDSTHVAIANDPREFAARVTEAVAAQFDPSSDSSRRELAAHHTWATRATVVLRLMALYRYAYEAPQSFAPLRRQPPA